MNSILTVTTAADSHDLTVLATVKAELQIDPANTKFDALLSNQWIPQASAAVASYCNRVFSRETVTETWRNVYDKETLILARYPVSSVTSVTVDGTALAASDYEYDAKTGFIYRLSSDTRVGWCAAKIVIVYAGGYALLGDLPFEIERATVLLCKFYRYTLAQNPLIKREDIPGVIETEYWVMPQGSPAMPRDVTDLLDPHRSLAV
jgi:hypothetical protein